MAFPLPFIAGAALGAVGTYVYKDGETKQWLNETSKKLKDSTNSLMASFKKKPEAEAVEQAVDAAEVTVETVADKVEETTQQ